MYILSNKRIWALVRDARIHPNNLPILQAFEVDARSGEVVSAINEPLNNGYDKNNKEDDNTIIWGLLAKEQGDHKGKSC